ncbi:MAG: arginine--tRNA ligase, partial [Thiovulaceae bacterium]|nr:arginine--tRNA ligase [Sulfurimonadaceae bacterium]
RKSPMVIAEELASSFGEGPTFSAVESIKGYINFRLSESFLDEYASWALENEEQFGSIDTNEKILIEFVSANPTGPLHIGHARGAVYGDTLLRLGRKLGFDVSAEYYVNDAGNQIDLLGLSIQLEGRSSILKEKVQYPESFYRGEYMTALAKEAAEVYGTEIFYDESRQKELALWAKDKVMEIIVSDLADANIHFDTFVSESPLYADWDRVMAKMGRGVYTAEGKTWIRSSEKWR